MASLEPLPLRIDPGLRQRLGRLADHDGRKVSEVAREALRCGVETRLMRLVELGELESAVDTNGRTSDETARTE